MLGGMLLSKDAIADVVEVLRPDDFYRPAHQTVYECILDLYGRGEPADAITVSSELQRRGDLIRLGGAPYLHTLIATVPTAANAAFYAEIVAEKAILRRLVEAGTRIVQLGYHGADGAEVNEIVDRAQAAIYDVTERSTSEDYVALEELLQPTMDEIDAIASRGGVALGVPTGFADLDAATNGLHPGQMIVVAARPGLGKALALDTPLPTPSGWTTMGDVAVGDALFGADGVPTRVVAVTEIMTDRPCYEVEFSDGTVITADAAHQWKTSTRASRRALAERVPPTFHWSLDGIAHVRELAAVAADEQDRLTTRKALLDEVGAEFVTVLNTAGRNVPPTDSLMATAHGAVRTFERRVPAYPLRALLEVLAAQVERPQGASQVAGHEAVITTAQMADTLRTSSADRRLNHAVAVAGPLQLPEADLPVPPYTLGAWLGDGTSAAAQITSVDPEIIAEIDAEGFRVAPSPSAPFRYSIRLPEPPAVAQVRDCVVCETPIRPATTQVRTCGRVCGCRSRALGLPRAPAPMCTVCRGPAVTGFGPCTRCLKTTGSAQAVLRRAGVLGNKHIPAIYLRASEWQRRALLAGLLDTDGTCMPGGTIVFAVTSRRLAEDSRELILSLGYRASISTKPVRGRSPESSVCYSVCFTPTDQVFRLPRKIARQRYSGGKQTAHQRFVVDVRPVSSVPVRCVQVDNAAHMYLAGRSMIPTHNSTLGLDFARSCSVKHGMTSAVFSLEMSRSEIVMRLLSAEARIRLADMRAGRMSDDDWTRMARRMSEISEAPLFIDDSPNLTLMEIRAKARRLKQRHDLKLVILDYLQLMTSGRKVESRQQEVSEFSRQIKLLAKELEVPVVAISQLNRGPEQRTDKRPMLSDLRESGCLTADTRLLRADTGTEVSLGELLASDVGVAGPEHTAPARDAPDSAAEPIMVWSLDERMRLVPRPLTRVFPSGVKEVFRLRMASGRELRASANHPFLTVDGWCPLGELAVGDQLATPRRVPVPTRPEPMPAERIVLLAQMIGSTAGAARQPLRHVGGVDVEPARTEVPTEAPIGADRAGASAALRDARPGAAGTALRLPAPFHLTPGQHNPLAAWLDELGLFGLRGHQKFVPVPVFALPDEGLALFLRQLWATDGTVGWDERNRCGRIRFTSTSRRLVHDVSRLLLRFGVLGRIERTRKAVSRDRWHLHIAESEHQRAFVRSVGVPAVHEAAARRLDQRLQAIADDTVVDTIPDRVWSRVQGALAARRLIHSGLDAARGSRFCGTTGWRHAPSRSRLALASALLADAELEMTATNDVSWDRIVEITSVGEQPVYDATVPGTHNFIADGIAVHNSIEQDADMVILLHRPDAFERDDPRAGEADLILAKHRNGPTNTITVAHQLHYSRFADLAHG